MDFEILFWILFLLAPAISRMFKKRKEAKKLPKQPKPHASPELDRRFPGDGRASEPQLTPFEEALRQIQDALAEANDQRQENVEPPVVAPPTRRQVRAPLKKSAASTPAERRMSLFEQVDARSKKPAKRIGPTVPEPDKDPYKESFYDEAFESKEPYQEPFHETVHSHIESSDEVPGAKKPRRKRSKWQQAYVMSEILDLPRSRTPWRSRMAR